MRQRMLASMAVVACLVTLVGCNSDEIPPTASPTGPSPSSSPVSTTPTPSRSLTPDQEDLRLAEDAITDYWRVIDGAASNPNQSLNILATVARSQALAQWQTTLSEYKAKHWRQVGLSSVRNAAATKDGKAFTVRACLDVSSLDVVDASGKSVVLTGRPGRQQYAYKVEKAPEGFFVTEDTLKGQPCDG